MLLEESLQLDLVTDCEVQYLGPSAGSVHILVYVFHVNKEVEVAQKIGTQDRFVDICDYGWMNEATGSVVCGPLNFRKRLLVWDAYKCHVMET